MYHISIDGKQKCFRKLKKSYPKWVNIPSSHLLGYVRDMKIHIEDQKEVSFYDNLWPKPHPLNHWDSSTMFIFLHSSKAHFERRGNLLEQPLQMAHKPLLRVLCLHHHFFFTEPFMFPAALPVNECWNCQENFSCWLGDLTDWAFRSEQKYTKDLRWPSHYMTFQPLESDLNSKILRKIIWGKVSNLSLAFLDLR